MKNQNSQENGIKFQVANLEDEMFLESLQLQADMEDIETEVFMESLKHEAEMVELENDVSTDDVLDAFEKAHRVMPIDAGLKLGSTAEIMEFAKDLGRSRGDMYEIPVWKESVNVVDGELFYMQAVHQESDVVPENVDCIRAMLELEEDGEKSILKTNKAMGIL
jgi:glyceraldehyde-3-phosphate dehydrogenase (NAD(P))